MNGVKRSKKPLDIEERKIKAKLIKLRTLIAFNIIASVLLIAVAVLSFIDKNTPSAVYFIAIVFLIAASALLNRFAVWYWRKVRLEYGVTGERVKGQTVQIRSYALKDKTYYVLTGFGFFGDALLIVGVIFLVSQAKIHPAFTVISILAGALVATVFHVAATVRYFRRKSAAEHNLSITGLQGGASPDGRSKGD